MFNISECKSYVNENECMKNNHLEFNTIYQVAFDGRDESVIYNIKEWLEANYNMYQYKKDNGVKYGTHELFYWASRDMPTYFTINYNDNMTDEKRIDITNAITEYITKQYPDATGHISINYHTQSDWTAINSFIENIDVSNIDNNDIAVVGIAYGKADHRGNTLTIPNREKALVIIEMEIKKYLNKNVTWQQPPFFGVSTIKYGKIKELPDGSYGFFEKRYRKRYYPISLNAICQFSIT